MGKLGTYKVTGIPLADRITSGNALFVSSVDGVDEITSYGSKPDRAVATIDYAINNSASGDTIYVMEGHRETINSTAALVPDVPKLSIIGIGNENNRPVISLSTSGSNETRIGITGANTLISNITFRANSTSVGSSSVGIRIGAADITLRDCRFDHNSTLSYFANTIELATGMHRATIQNCQFVNFGTTAQSARAVDLSGTAVTNHLLIGNCSFTGNWSNAPVWGSTDYTARGFRIADNHIFNNSTIGSDPCIRFPSSANINGGAGIIHNNWCNSGASGSSTQILIAPYFRGEGNYVANSSGIKMTNFLA